MVKGIQTYATHEGSGHGLRPEMVATALSDLADDNAVFTVDTGMCNVWGARYLAMKEGRRILASFSHGSMANAMPQAIGAKVGSPDRQVIAMCGDGGFSMLMGELLTAAGLDIPVKLMIFNNSTLGMVRAEMMVVGYQPWGTDVKNPDFGAIATAAGHPRGAGRERRRCAPGDRASLRPSGSGAHRLRHRPSRAGGAAAYDDRGEYAASPSPPASSSSVVTSPRSGSRPSPTSAT